jgi:UDP-N-acetylglucosamine 2-epimerase (non-hydrolysing)
LEDTLKGIKVSDPLDYLKIMGLTQHCFKAITDSGGYQKETYFAGKRAAVLMPETGWVELILNKWNKLVDPDSIYDFIFSTDQIEYEEDVYGKGNAADQIINYLGEKS